MRELYVVVVVAAQTISNAQYNMFPPTIRPTGVHQLWACQQMVVGPRALS